MSSDRHRFRHLTDQEYHNLVAEVLPLTAPSELRHPQEAGPEADAATASPGQPARSRDPATGRWASQDPLDFDRCEDHRYRYVSRDPSACGLGLDSAPAPLGLEWTGRASDVEEGLQANRVRCCAPTPGVWLAEDGRVVPAEPPPP